MGLFGSGNAISWTNRAKCPPIEDCPVKNTVKKGGKPTAKQAREARKLAARKTAAVRARKGKAAPEPEPPRKGWPFAGSYSPPRERGRGR